MEQNHTVDKAVETSAAKRVINLELTEAAYTLLAAHGIMNGNKTPEAAAMEAVRSHVATITQVPEEEISDIFIAGACVAKGARP